MAGEDSVPDFTTRTKELVNTTVDNTDNAYVGDVVGRKDDTAATAVNNTNSMMRYIKTIYSATVGASGLDVKQSIAGNVQLNDRLMFFIGLTQRGIGKITAANIDIITATCKIYRSTGGGAYVFVADIGLTKADGKVSFNYQFTAGGGWSNDDSWYIENDGIICTMSPSGTASVGLLNWTGDITEEPDIKSQVDAIRNTDFPNVEGTGFVKDTDSLVNLSHKAGVKGSDAIKDETALIKASTDTYLNATISSRATQTSVDDIPATGNAKDFNATQKGYLSGLVIGGVLSLTSTGWQSFDVDETDAVTEQLMKQIADTYTLDVPSGKREAKEIKIDVRNLTKDVSAKLYEKGFDGNIDLKADYKDWAITDEEKMISLALLTIDSPINVKLLSAGGGAGTVTIRYKIIYQTYT